MSVYLLVPPVAFALLVIVVWLLFAATGPLAYRRKAERGALDKPYAGGEDLASQRLQPDYAQFFPFAFFFTVMHVVALVLTTIPSGDVAAHGLGLVYVFGAIVALLILFRN